MTRYSGAIIDIDVHHRPGRYADLIEYLPERWRPLATERDAMSRLRRVENTSFGGLGAFVHHRRDGSKYEELCERLLDPYGYTAAVLSFDVGDSGALANPYFAAALCRAANDWNRETWLSIGDDRLFSLITVAPHLALEAAEEIERVGGAEQIVGVLLAGSPSGLAFGDPHFDPIFRVAEEMGLAVAVHASQADRPTQQTAAGGGPKSTLIEHATLTAQQGMHLVSSLIVHGVFEKFPRLRVQITEFGLAWLPAFLWKLDAQLDALRRESPWVRRRPSEYVLEHITFGTQPIEESNPRHALIDLLAEVDGIERMLTFSSDFPHVTGDDPAYAARSFPTRWLRPVFFENACRAFRFPRRVQETTIPAVLTRV